MTPTTNTRQLFRFWLPLQLTWLMMAIENPFLAAVIARMADPVHNLAAYGVSYALAILMEAPVIMIMSAATALVDSAANYRKLRNFTWALNIMVTVCKVTLIFTPLWDVVTDQWMGLDAEVARLTRGALILLLPFPAAIGFRRFCQGMLIRSGQTRLVALGTGFRLLAMLVTAFVATKWGNWPGTWVGAAALSVGVVAEAIASRVMARGAIAAQLADTNPSIKTLSYGDISRFYYPLALTSTISLVVHPMVTFFMGHARLSLESLAVLPVINALVFIFRTPGLSYQEAAITMLGRSWSNFPQVRRFALLLGLGSTLGLLAIAVTPLARVWLQTISGLTVELADLAYWPLRVLVILPFLSVWLSWQRSLLVISRKTSPITWASTLEVAGIFIVLFLLVNIGGWIGINAAAVAFLAGRLASNFYLIKPTSYQVVKPN